MSRPEAIKMSNPEVTGWSTPEYEDFELFFGEGIKTSDNKAIAPTSFNLPDNREDLAKRNEDMSEYWFGEAPASAATEVINEYTGLPIFHEKKRSRLSYDSSNSELENAMNYAMSFVETVDTPPKVPAKKTTSNKSDDESENGCNDGEVTMIEDSPIPVAGAASPALPHDKVETFCCLIIDNSVQRISVKETARIMKLREANLEKALNKSHLATCCTTKTPQDAPKQFRVKYWCEINSPEALEELLICDNFHFNSVIVQSFLVDPKIKRSMSTLNSSSAPASASVSSSASSSASVSTSASTSASTTKTPVAPTLCITEALSELLKKVRSDNVAAAVVAFAASSYRSLLPPQHSNSDAFLAGQNPQQKSQLHVFF